MEFYKDARGYVNTYEFAAAVGSIHQAAQFDPSSVEIKAYDRRLERVLELFDDRIRQENQSHVFLEGLSKYIAAEYQTALLCLGSALGNWPLDDRLQRFIGEIEKETGYKLDRNNVRPTPELVSLKLEKASENFNENRLTEAMILCREVILLEPDNALAYKRMGSIHFAQGNFEQARDLWRQALALEPEDEELTRFVQLAEEKMKRGKK